MKHVSGIEPAKVGPNAATQLRAVLKEYHGQSAMADIFNAAGLLAWVDRPPSQMICQKAAQRLFDAVASHFTQDETLAILEQAGKRTGAYVHDNRIPVFARVVLRALPTSIAANLLMRAIQKSAWTFAGSGRCQAQGKIIRIYNNPLKTPQAIWHVGVIETLFQRLVSGQSKVSFLEGHQEDVAFDEFRIVW